MFIFTVTSVTIMEEFESKLHSDDKTVVCAKLSKLIENILKDQEKIQCKQISFLQNQVFTTDTIINEIASEGILKLVKNGILDSEKLLEEIVIMIPISSLTKGVVKTIFGVLYYNQSKDISKQRYNMFQPQHPLLTLALTNSDCFSYIYKEIRSAPNDPSWNIWNYSFYQYCFCNPLNEKPMYYKMKLWLHLLLSNEDNELILKLINWLPSDPSGSLLVSAELLNELSFVSTRITIDGEMILLLQASALVKLVSEDHDSRETISAIKFLLNQVKKIECINPILLMLAKSLITGILPTHTLEILKICEVLVDQPEVTLFVLKSLKASILYWIGNPSILSRDVSDKASEVYNKISNKLNENVIPKFNDEETFKRYQNIIAVNSELFISFELSALCKSWKNKNLVLEFLRKIGNSRHEFIRKTIHLIFGIFICDLNDDEVTLAAFKVICTYLENSTRFSHVVLTLILYSLSNTSNSRIHFELFKYLPKLANIGDNYIKVISTIKVLCNSSDDILKTFGMRLMYDLWRKDKNSYPLLEDMLTQEEPIQHKWEFYINKAYIIRQICEVNSKLYGEEMVAHLSRILNKCSGGEGELASSIAIDAITILCKEGVIDIKTTWLTLSPKYLEDKRTKTVKSMFGLASVISKLMHPEHHQDLQRDIIRTIWHYVINSADDDVKKSALDSLVEFGLENISAHFPEQYLNEEMKSDVLPQLIPGVCWINFMRDQSNLPVVANFIIKMVHKEVDDYPKYVYHITSKKEPSDYSHLPTHSIVRALVSYCTSQMGKWNSLYKHVFIECMRILSQEFSKPLPPYNWSFLQELHNEPELKTYCLTIFAHQVMTSGTARRFMEKYIETLTGNYEDLEGVLFIYRNLRFLANSIQPMIFERFFSSTLNYAQHLKIVGENEELINLSVEALNSLLSDPSVQDVSKKGIVSYLDENLTSLKESDEIFQIFASCVPHCPVDLIKNITVLSKIDRMTDELYRKAVQIRCQLAVGTEGKLKWLDDLIDRDRPNLESDYSLQKFLETFKQQRDMAGCVQWTRDLIGRIEVAIADNCKPTYSVYLMEVLVVALVSFSGCHVFTSPCFNIQEYIDLFPQANNILLETPEWSSSSSEVIECYYFLNSNKDGLIPEEYRNIFGKTLQALRDHVEFKKGNKWLKYLNADVS